MCIISHDSPSLFASTIHSFKDQRCIRPVLTFPLVRIDSTNPCPPKWPIVRQRRDDHQLALRHSGPSVLEVFSTTWWGRTR
eukprot:g16909.t1